MATDPRSHRCYRNLRAALLNQAKATILNGGTITCWLCGDPLDPWQPYAAGRNGAAPTLEHITPLSAGGSLLDPTNAALAHQLCQSQQGARIRNTVTIPGPRRNSRRW